jgi:small subunit ribosomal protein S17
VAEEEKNDQVEEVSADETAAEAQAEEAPAQETPADEAPAPEAEEAPAEDAASDAAAAETSADDGEQAEALTPKQRRKVARATRKRRPRPQLSPQQRQAERDALRKKKAAARRQQRLKLREQKRERGPREGTPPVVKEAGAKRVRQGVVVSSKADKTITVQIQKQESHPVYKKVVRTSTKLHAHDERNEANPGDTVRVVECRPLSRTKRWRLVEVVERAR